MAVTRLFSIRRPNEGAAIATNMANTVSVTISSIRVNPCMSLRRDMLRSVKFLERIMIRHGRFVRYAEMAGAFVRITGCRRDYQVYGGYLA